MPPFLPSLLYRHLLINRHLEVLTCNPSTNHHRQSDARVNLLMKTLRDVVDSGFDEEIHTMKEEEEFLNFLNVQHDHLPTDTEEEFTHETFIETANSMAISMKSQCECLFPYLYLAPLPTLKSANRFSR